MPLRPGSCAAAVYTLDPMRAGTLVIRGRGRVAQVAGNLIRGLIAEVEGQPSVLERFRQRGIPGAAKGSIIVGAGDSYAAALAGFYASRGRFTALDPYSLAASPEMAEGADVYFISVSGRTSSNLLAVEKAKGWARRTIAVTAVKDSRLALTTDRTVELPMVYAPRTPGMLSFSLSLLAVMMMAQADMSCDFHRALVEARKHNLDFASPRGTTFLLGNSLAYPAALYAAAKSYEVLGVKAQAELLEEFSHLELFSVGRSDVVNSFGCFDPRGQAEKLSRALSARGFRAGVVQSWGDSAAEQLFHCVFQIQLSTLQEAEAMGLKAPRFLSSRKALGASDAMIY